MSTNIVVMLVTRGQQRQHEITILKPLKVPATLQKIFPNLLLTHWPVQKVQKELKYAECFAACYKKFVSSANAEIFTSFPPGIFTPLTFSEEPYQTHG